jgi:hypothetical protein
MPISNFYYEPYPDDEKKQSYKLKSSSKILLTETQQLSKYNDTELAKYKDEIKTECKEDDEENYQEWKIEFEKMCCKVIDPASIIYMNSLGEYEFLDVLSLSAKLSHKGKKYCEFIGKWWYDPEMRVYSRADLFSPTQDCPLNIYNLWKPYPYQDKTVDMSNALQEEVEFILHHIKILSNHNEEVYQYTLNWIAQFLQYPHVKTTMIALTSMEGAGKDSFLHLIKKMLGKGQVVETTKPEEVFGRFNSILANCRLVILNEMNASDTNKYDKDMKSLVTEDTITIEGKGKALYKMTSFHRIMLFTNKTDFPIQTSKSDRRKLIARCSDEKIGDDVYFDRLYSLMENEDVLTALFLFFINRDVEEFNRQRGRKIPKSDYQLNIADNYSDPIEDWLQYLVEIYYEEQNRESLEWSSVELLGSFREFSNLNGIKLELTSQQLGVRIKNKNIAGIVQHNTSKSKGRTLILKDIKEHFFPLMSKVKSGVQEKVKEDDEKE